MKIQNSYIEKVLYMKNQDNIYSLKQYNVELDKQVKSSVLLFNMVK